MPRHLLRSGQLAVGVGNPLPALRARAHHRHRVGAEIARTRLTPRHGSPPVQVRRSELADGQDRQVVLHGPQAEVIGGIQQLLAQHAGQNARIPPDGVTDPLLAELLVAVTGLSQAIGVHDGHVVTSQRNLTAEIGPVRVQHQERAGRPQRPRAGGCRPSGSVCRRNWKSGPGLRSGFNHPR
jgi:hypothetical protein